MLEKFVECLNYNGYVYHEWESVKMRTGRKLTNVVEVEGLYYSFEFDGVWIYHKDSCFLKAFIKKDKQFKMLFELALYLNL